MASPTATLVGASKLHSTTAWFKLTAMPVRLLGPRERLPDPRDSDPSGLVAVGGDLLPERLIDAYRRGIFPWYEEGLPILWHSPDPRMVLEPRRLHVGRTLEKRCRASPYTITLDQAFGRVIDACAEVPRPGQRGTWITDEMRSAYKVLHTRGLAHSAEAWDAEGQLVGGLYGVAAGAVYCGESMFVHEPDASKVAFVALVRQLERWGFELIDCQVHTEHLERFGAVEWPRDRFLERLAELLERPDRPGPWAFDPD
jgi:leucyl/phenylalanyl-tRNA--protein transferase